MTFCTHERCGMRCNVSPVCIHIMLTLDVAEKWTVGTKCNNSLVLFVCIGRTRLGGGGLFGDVVLLKGGFPGRAHGVIPYPKPKKETPPIGVPNIMTATPLLGAGLNTPSHNCRVGMRQSVLHLEDCIQHLHMMVHAVVHIQQFVNKWNLGYQPFGPWKHFPGQCSTSALLCRRVIVRSGQPLPLRMSPVATTKKGIHCTKVLHPLTCAARAVISAPFLCCGGYQSN